MLYSNPTSRFFNRSDSAWESTFQRSHCEVLEDRRLLAATVVAVPPMISPLAVPSTVEPAGPFIVSNGFNTGTAVTNVGATGITDVTTAGTTDITDVTTVGTTDITDATTSDPTLVASPAVTPGAVALPSTILTTNGASTLGTTATPAFFNFAPSAQTPAFGSFGNVTSTSLLGTTSTPAFFNFAGNSSLAAGANTNLGTTTPGFDVTAGGGAGTGLDLTSSNLSTGFFDVTSGQGAGSGIDLTTGDVIGVPVDVSQSGLASGTRNSNAFNTSSLLLSDNILFGSSLQSDSPFLSGNNSSLPLFLALNDAD